MIFSKTNKGIVLLSMLLMLSVMVVFPVIVMAEDRTTGEEFSDEDKAEDTSEEFEDGEEVKETETAEKFRYLSNPLDGGEGKTPIVSFTDFIARLLNIVIMVGIPIVVLAIIWAGFLYVKAQGNPEKIKAAHQTLLWTIIGAALLIGSYTIAKAIEGTVEKIGTTSSIMQQDNDTFV